VDHPLTVEFALGCVMQNVKPYQSGQQFLVLQPCHAGDTAPF